MRSRSVKPALSRTYLLALLTCFVEGEERGAAFVVIEGDEAVAEDEGGVGALG